MISDLTDWVIVCLNGHVNAETDQQLSHPVASDGNSVSEFTDGMDFGFEWLEMENREWACMVHGDIFKAMDACELLNRPSPPEWFNRGMEYQYRKGFMYGISKAANYVRRLYNLGFLRGSEIANILETFSHDLRDWKIQAICHKKPLKQFGEPSLKIESWSKIKAMVHERDEWRCRECGCADALECHHVVPVCEGGLPVDSNLITLCRSCHKSK